MNLVQYYQTKNDCYLAARPIKPCGIMIHSTGANNPTLKRYVGPDDGKLGNNVNGNHWNQPTPGGKKICAHAFIGKLADGSIATYQTLPWEFACWLSGAGDLATAKKNGFSGNNANFLGYLQFEICEDGLSDKAYFEKTYKEALELCVYLCDEYNIPVDNKRVICHSEGYKLGIASNHSDIMHWWSKHQKSMDAFRGDLAKMIAEMTTPAQPDELYRVRKSWEDKKSQIGAFKILENAKYCANANKGYKVYNSAGELIYSPAEQGTPPEDTPPKLNAGMVLALKNEPLYISSTAKNKSKNINGTYYLWGTAVVSGRVRITNKKNRVGVTGQVTGWIAASSIK